MTYMQPEDELDPRSNVEFSETRETKDFWGRVVKTEKRVSGPYQLVKKLLELNGGEDNGR